MTPDELRSIGVALYGRHWQTDLAEAIGMDPRHMRRLAKGTHRVTDSVRDDIRKAVAEKAEALDNLARSIAQDGRK